MRKYLFKGLLLIAMILPISSCENSLSELNTDPNNPTTANIDLVFTAGETSILYKFGRFTNGSDWNMWAGLWTQAFAGNHGSGINFDQYTLRNADGLWATWYDGLNDLKYVIDEGSKVDAWTHVGASQVMQALALGTLTSVYGDLPFSEALQGSVNPQPTFDTQEQIYNTIFQLLSDGITNLNKTPAAAFDLSAGNADFVFSGDADKWKTVAYALEARYRNHFSIKDPTGSATAALTAVDNAKAAGYTSHDADLVFPYSGQGIYLNGFFHLFENNQMIASENFIAALNADNDPRIRAIWNDENTDGVFLGYIGKKNGFGTDPNSYSPIGPKGYYGKADSKQLISSYTELLFIEAEAAFRSGDLDRAATALNAGITSHMNLVTPAAIETLTTEGGDVAGYQQQITDYLNNNANETNATVTIEKIMTQKHRAMVCMNGESWVDVRRHDHQYPSFLAIPEDQSGNPFATEFIQRVLYPQESVSANANTPTTVTIFDKLWIFQ